MSYAYNKRKKLIKRQLWDYTATNQRHEARIAEPAHNQTTIHQTEMVKPGFFARIRNFFVEDKVRIKTLPRYISVSRPRTIMHKGLKVMARIKKLYVQHPTKGWQIRDTGIQVLGAVA